LHFNKASLQLFAAKCMGTRPAPSRSDGDAPKSNKRCITSAEALRAA
jgi:hypothetical protein